MKCKHAEVEVRILGVTDDIYTVRRRGEVRVTGMHNDMTDSSERYRVECKRCGARREFAENDPQVASLWMKEALAVCREDRYGI